MPARRCGVVVMLRRRNLSPARVVRLLAGGVAGFVGLAVLLYFTSAHFQAGTSDGATVILEGQALASGHVLLHGWVLTVSSYWTSSAVFDGLAILLGGLRAGLLYATPAVAGAVAVAVGALLAREGRRGWAGFAGAVAVVALLAFSAPALSFFFVGRGFHVSTAGYALLAFIALRRVKFGWGWALAVLMLSAGMLGDLLMVAYGVVPLAIAGCVAMARERRLRAGMVEFTAAVASVVLTWVTHLALAAFGAFTTSTPRPVIRSSQMITNLGHVPVYVASLFGLTDSVVTSGGVFGQLRNVHGLGIVNSAAALCVLACVVFALVSLVVGLAGRSPRGRLVDGEPGPWRLDNTLVIAVLCAAVPFVFFAGRDGAGIRYLTVCVVFASVLAGRMIARAGTSLRTARSIRAFALAGAVLALGMVASFGYAMSGPQLSNSVTRLAAWLETDGLHEGIGGYWVASITTVETGGAVTVRPVLAGNGGQIERQLKLSSAGWYEGSHFRFLVLGAPIGYGGIREVVTTWGRPEHVEVIGPYRVLVWSHRLAWPPPHRGPPAIQALPS